MQPGFQARLSVGTGSAGPPQHQHAPLGFGDTEHAHMLAAIHQVGFLQAVWVGFLRVDRATSGSDMIFRLLNLSKDRPCWTASTQLLEPGSTPLKP